MGLASWFVIATVAALTLIVGLIAVTSEIINAELGAPGFFDDRSQPSRPGGLG